MLALVFLAWFPAPWFEVQDAAPIFGLLVGVHLLAAPALTAYLFKPGKKGLVFDLVVVAVLQLGALGYGAWALYSERPSYLVFSVDRYVALAEKDVDFAAAGRDGFGAPPAAGPLYVFAEMPMGRAFQQLQDSVLFEGAPDLERRPEFWRPFDATRAAVLKSAMPLGHLRRLRPEHDAALAAMAVSLGQDPDSAPWLPLMGKKSDFAAFIDPDTAEVLDVVRMDPWVSRP